MDLCTCTCTYIVKSKNITLPSLTMGSLRAGPVAYTGGILLLLLLLWVFKATPFHPTHHPHSPIAKSHQDSKMGIFHIVMFQFKESASAEQVQDVIILSS